MDITGANFFRVLDMIRTRLGANPVAIQLPIGSEDTFIGIIDLVKMDALQYKGDKGEIVEESTWRARKLPKRKSRLL